MPSLRPRAATALRLARVLLAARKKKLLLLAAHGGRLTGNALGLAHAAQQSPDFLPVFLGAQAPPLEIPWFPSHSRPAQILWERAFAVAYTTFHRYDFALGEPRGLRLFLWHGMPIKGIGKFDRHAAEQIREDCDFAVATSELTAGIMASSFELPREKFLLTGEPKTDALPASAWMSALRQRHRKIVAWLPTWREKFAEVRGEKRLVGDDEAMLGFVRRLTGDGRLKELLVRHDAAFVLRMHTLNSAAAPPIEPPFYRMDGADGEAVHLLEAANAIVADYSSLAIDALLFDRPLALWCEDFAVYTAQRALPYFDFRETFGWALQPSLDDLVGWLAARLEGAPVSEAVSSAAEHCRRLFHQHPRGGAGARLLAAIRGRLP